MVQLKPDGKDVRLPAKFGQTIVLRTPGLAGEASVVPPPAPGTRSADLSSALDEALERSGFDRTLELELAGTREIRGPTAPVRSTALGKPGLELIVPEAPDGWQRVLLHADEAGILSVHYPEPGAGDDTFIVPRQPSAPVQGADGTRGLVSLVGRKLLKVLTFKAVRVVGGAAAAHGIERWETENRPHGVRSFEPESYTHGDVPYRQDDPAFWQNLQDGDRALLMIHGTFSSTHAAFGTLPEQLVADLASHYQGRVFAFDHPTVSVDPAHNVSQLADKLDGLSHLDIICHSRGGLVARELANQLPQVVHNIVFVATPNAGTPLADPAHMRASMNVYLNLINLFPDNGVTDVLAVLLEVLKEVAAGALGRLEGLKAMDPGGAYLDALNGTASGSSANLYALAANYEPEARLSAWKGWIADVLLDRIFKQENDLVVPTAGVYAAAGPGFPVIGEDRRAVLAASDSVAHCSFFGHPAAEAHIRRWLRVP